MTETLIEPVVEHRSGAGHQVADVNFPKRIVTCIAMPYETATEIFERGRSFTEIVSRGAFDGIEKRAGRIRANRDHSWDKVVGKIVGLHPSRKEGLVAEVKMFSTQDGEDALRLCDEGGLDASAGLTLLRRDDGRVWDDAEQWDRSRTVRRLNRLWLDHLAFVPDPAYPDAAVLSVRHTPGRPQEAPEHEHTSVPRPNLVQVHVNALEAAYADIDRRYTRASE